MSDNWIILIPEEPHFVPIEDAQVQALSHLKAYFPEADEVYVNLSQKVRLVDCGSNLERVVCQVCGSEIDPDWWREWAESEFEEDFPLQARSLPCCGVLGSLRDLDYDWPQGFARFSIEVMNPSRDIEPRQIKETASILGCSLLKILVHL